MIVFGCLTYDVVNNFILLFITEYKIYHMETETKIKLCKSYAARKINLKVHGPIFKI